MRNFIRIYVYGCPILILLQAFCVYANFSLGRNEISLVSLVLTVVLFAVWMPVYFSYRELRRLENG